MEQLSSNYNFIYIPSSVCDRVSSSLCTALLFIHHNVSLPHEVIYLSDNSCNTRPPTVTYTLTHMFTASYTQYLTLSATTGAAYQSV